MSDRPMVPADFQVGDRVVIGGWLLRGRVGTVFCHARLLWRQAWMVELDGGDWRIRRTRVLERALRHVAPST